MRRNFASWRPSVTDMVDSFVSMIYNFNSFLTCETRSKLAVQHSNQCRIICNIRGGGEMWNKMEFRGESNKKKDEDSLWYKCWNKFPVPNLNKNIGVLDLKRFDIELSATPLWMFAEFYILNTLKRLNNHDTNVTLTFQAKLSVRKGFTNEYYAKPMSDTSDKKGVMLTETNDVRAWYPMTVVWTTARYGSIGVS